MSKTLVAMTLIFCAGVLGAFALFLQYNRYQLTEAGSGSVYKIDRKTGRTWIVVANREVDVLAGGERDVSGKTPSLDLGKAAYRVNQFVKFTLAERVKKTVIPEQGVTVEAYTGARVAGLTSAIELIGWDAEEKKPGVWLVTYLYNEGAGPKGFYFEVEAAGGQVRFISQGSDLEGLYGLDCKETLCMPRKQESGGKPAAKEHAAAEKTPVKKQAKA